MSSEGQVRSRAVASEPGPALELPELPWPFEVVDRGRSGDRRQAILRVTHPDGALIVKLYGRKQSWGRAVWRDLASRAVGKTSTHRMARWRTERQVLELWGKEGFEVPKLVDLEIPELAHWPHLVMECVIGRTIWEILGDPKVTLREKDSILERFAAGWAARHRRAREIKEPCLIQMRAGFHHVILADERMVHFDFESCYTRRHSISRLISLEIVGYLRTLAAAIPKQLPRLLDSLLRGYPDRDQLHRVERDVSRGIFPPARWLSLLQMRMNADDHDSKVRVQRELRAALGRLVVKS